MPFNLDADQLRDYIRQNQALAERAEGEGNLWLAQELEDVAREAAEQLSGLIGGRLLVGR